MKNQDLFSIINTTKARLPSLPFRDAATEILGDKYDLSLAIVQDKAMKMFVSHALQANTVFQVQVRSSKQYVSHALEVNIVLQVQDKQMQMFVFHALQADTVNK